MSLELEIVIVTSSWEFGILLISLSGVLNSCRTIDKSRWYDGHLLSLYSYIPTLFLLGATSALVNDVRHLNYA